MSADFIKVCKPLKLSPAQKAVLMTMAWYATDAGEFWYSVATICEWTCLSERTVRQALSDLTKLQAVKAEFRTGASTRYTLTPAAFAPLQSPAPAPEKQDDTPPTDAQTPAATAPLTPAADAPLRELHPAADAGDPCERCTPTPAGNAAPPAASAPDKQEELFKTNKTNRARASAQRTYSVTDLVALGVNQQHAEDFLETRKKKGAKALSQSAMDLLEREAKLAGLSLAEAIQEAAEHGWRGFKAEWLKKNSTGRGFSRHSGFDQRDYTAGIGPNGEF